MLEYRSKIGFVQQDPYGALPPFMSIQRILEEPLIINGIKRQAERLERVQNGDGRGSPQPGGRFHR